MSTTDAVLLMAYGSPDSLDEVGAYYTHIRGGRQPSAEAVAGLQERYRRVGGRTPLLDVTRQLQHSLEQVLARTGGRATRVYIGMKHWHPFIADTVRGMQADGVTHVTAIPLAPHYSRMSIGGYRQALEQAAADRGAEFAITFVASWHRHPAFVELLADLVGDALGRFPPLARQTVTTVFTAHSLPEKIRQWNDPYESEVAESGAAVARRVGLTDWRVAWQSAGATGEPWIGPDILDTLTQLAADGVRHVLQVPIGFVCEHLEILYDIDVEAQQRAAELGIVLRRTEMPNASEAFVRTLAAVVADASQLTAIPSA